MTSTLFDWVEAPLPVRSSDPMTSVVAAKSVNMRERKREVLDAMGRAGGAVTASQIQQLLRDVGVLRERGTIASRLSQLEHDGLVAKSGVRQVPKPLGTGRPETTWRLA